MLEGQGGLNRVAFLTQLGQEWIPPIPDVHLRLQADPPARVIAVSVALAGRASAWRVATRKCDDGFDLDVPTIQLASANAQEMGVAHRVAFQVGDAGTVSIAADGHDLVLAFECIDDMAGPTMGPLLDWTAAVFGATGEPLRAARLSGAAGAHWRACAAKRYQFDNLAYERDLFRRNWTRSHSSKFCRGTNNVR